MLQPDASGKVDKLEHGVYIVRQPGHLLSFESAPGPPTGKVSVAGRGGGGGNLDPENLICGTVLWLDQELHPIDPCNVRSIYALRNAASKR